MPISQPDYQLRLPLNGIEETIQEFESLSTEEVRRRSESALNALMVMRIKNEGSNEEESPRWFELWKRLRDAGWPWRVAAYIAWSAVPHKYRWPKTQDELAIQCLGLTSNRAIATWRKKNPTIGESISQLQSAILFDAVPDVMDAMVQVATMPDYKGHQDRKLILEMTDKYTPRTKLETSRGNGAGRKILRMLDKVSTEKIIEMLGDEALEIVDELREEVDAKEDLTPQPLPKREGEPGAPEEDE